MVSFPAGPLEVYPLDLDRSRRQKGGTCFNRPGAEGGVEAVVDARSENRPGLKRFDAGEDVVVAFHPEAAEALTE